MSDVRENRIDLIRALESGEYNKGVSSLYRVESDTYCCIGVGCHLLDIPTPELNTDNSQYYNLFSKKYDASFKVRNHLILMNDGDTRIRNYVAYSGPGIRNFSFIARFLRKIWGLSDV